jgi:hypothetical protein
MVPASSAADHCKRGEFLGEKIIDIYSRREEVRLKVAGSIKGGKVALYCTADIFYGEGPC